MAYEGAGPDLPLSLKTLHLFNEQQVFDFVVGRQWRRLHNGTDWDKFPTAMRAKNGWRCAAGELISDEEWQEYGRPQGSWCSLVQLTGITAHQKLCGELLLAHDRYHDSNVLVMWPKAWQEIAVRHKLNPALVPEVQGPPVAPPVEITSSNGVITVDFSHYTATVNWIVTTADETLLKQLADEYVAACDVACGTAVVPPGWVLNPSAMIFTPPPVTLHDGISAGMGGSITLTAPISGYWMEATSEEAVCA